MIEHLAVVIPARNEGERLGACLRSVRDAVARLHQEMPAVGVRVVVVLDSCDDDSHDIAAAFGEVMLVHTGYSNVGAARATGARWALQALRGLPERTWIANTDADSTVPTGWLVDQLELADRGGDLTLGAVEPVLAELSSGQRAAWELAHPLGAEVGTVHGANLGVRASVYLAAGGFEARTEHEDVRLVESVRDLGGAVVNLGGAPVLTSGRSIGRTPGGYAGYLTALDPVAVG
ncbi:glycosyltransferase involved in cell wall biosynthesis [Leifsonia sp. AK011]|uniref:glycosyltransferase n=1 Tax=Leifsonia sp. AK011 TaxID=2723075 RepID=UPI0015CD486C|nr:glycosyltransferase [Leifsonia sp. AK011]NYF09088.1 glycosyltransferase involved in cell wall biosynthesis [Leifsonia sp. AK011]